MKRFLSFFVLALIGGAAAGITYHLLNPEKRSGNLFSSQPIPVKQASYTPHAAVIGPDFIDAADQSVHAVVHVKTEYQQKNTLYDFFFRDFINPYQGGRGRPFVATGSGVIISADGYIVTNNHVVQDADYIEVTMNDKRTLEAKLVGNDPSTDIALLKVQEPDLPYLLFGNSDMVRVGEWVLAVGNPFNLTSTVTAGIVSAKARNINILGDNSAIESFIQTDAVVNPGNSGGALVNTSGELIAINAAIASNTGSYTGYSFAIPANLVKKVVEDLRDYGVTQRGYMGITPADITSDLARKYKIPQMKGVYVYSVTDDGSAREAGLASGDIITNINTVPVNSVSELLEVVGQYRPGDKLAVTYQRDGKEKTGKITLKNRDGSYGLVKKPVFDPVAALGAEFEPLSQEEKRYFRMDGGVKVTKLKEGLLATQGIREGFVITAVDKNLVREPSDIQKYLSGKKGGVLFEGLYPNGKRAYYLVVLK